MSYAIAGADRAISLEANEDHTGKEGYAVKFSSGKAALQTSDSAVDTIGVISEGQTSGSKSSILLNGYHGRVRLKLAASPGTVNAGTRLGTHTDGTWKATASTKNYSAMAVESGTAGVLVEAILFDVPAVTA